MQTAVIHAGQSPEPVTGAVMPPVFQTSTYAQEWPAKHTGYEYARGDNPTRQALQRCVAALESAEHGIAFGSGLGATSTILQALPANAKVVGGDDLYGGTYRLFERIYRKRGMDFSYADFSQADPAEVIAEGTHLVWLETPTNPLLKVADVAAIAARCRAVGATLAVDNTFATPIFQRPIELGAHLVVHSTTKYLNGHSDVVGGIVLTSEPEWAEQLTFLQNASGAVPGPWDSWLTLRGVKTLAIRMAKHQENAQRIVAWLADHDEVERLHYPMWESDPGYALAKKQMSGFGGMISFVLRGDLARAERLVASTKLFTLAESLGGVESLIELPASMTHASVPPEQRAALGIDDGLIRLSVGIEHVGDLVADLQQAMDVSVRG
ncbi:MAG: PLP-dependent aspartate aminotransferase family protein [Myxococcales bacterium]|nr:PLP-dependent aspartate aminotransferase family protein [Myxococcales bacterium]